MQGVVLLVTCVLFAMASAPAMADPFDETPAVALNRSIDMVAVKGGCYSMGSSDPASVPNERPQHDVCVKDFLLGKYPVTQSQWISVMGKNPSAHQDCGDLCPVENVSWNDIQVYLQRLQARTGKSYRLPTEAEWEYAARSGGRDVRWAGTNDEKTVGDYAWYLNNARFMSHPVGKKKPNGLGLYDMTGNVWEWVSDWYAEDYYKTSSRQDPQGPAEGRMRTLRGGYWGDSAVFARVTRRIGLSPDAKAPGYGFRLAQSAQ
jgi:formylglycine-generating enzyme required for sulfatase activity